MFSSLKLNRCIIQLYNSLFFRTLLTYCKLTYMIQCHDMQGEDICVALQTHINDVMLRRYSRSHGNGSSVASSSVDASVVSKPPGMEAYEKHVKEMSKLLEESQRKIDQVFILHLS